MAKFKVNVGINLPNGKRYEPGDMAEDIPGQDIKWLREQGIIELVGRPKGKKDDDDDGEDGSG